MTATGQAERSIRLTSATTPSTRAGETGLLNWWKLRSVGNLTILKVSYVALAAAPFLTKFREIGRFLALYDDKVVLASFFGGIFLASANLIYDIFCPTVIKRFDSPNTLYKEIL